MVTDRRSCAAGEQELHGVKNSGFILAADNFLPEISEQIVGQKRTRRGRWLSIFQRIF